MSRARYWTCRACRKRWPRTKQVCATAGCAGRRPAARRPKHQLVLELEPYDTWVVRFGERCNICGRPPGPKRRLDRDHDHRTGQARGLLCHRCNRALHDWVTATWLRRALTYLERDRQPT